MNKFLAIFAILIAVGVMLYQVIDFVEVKKEYEPLVSWLPDTPPITDAQARINAAVGDNKPPVPSASHQNTEMPIDPDSPEISNIDYDWMNYYSVKCYPGAKEDVRAAFANDNTIRENEKRIIGGRCQVYNEQQDKGAKQALKEAVQ